MSTPKTLTRTSFNQNTRIRIAFSEADKQGIDRVLSKFPSYDVACELQEIVKVAGETVMTSAEALILAGLLRPWYSYISDQLNLHPGLWQ